LIVMAEPLWLEFVNTTLADRGQPVDLIPDVDRLIVWLVRAGALSSADATSARRSPALLKRAHALRSALREQAERIAAGHPAVSAAAAAEINRVLRAAPGYEQITVRGGRVALRAVTTPTDPMGVLAPVARSAAEFLSSGDFALLKHCEGKGCVLLFYDTTKNHARRFCSADVCGNRYKAAARYERMKRRRAASAQSADAAHRSEPTER
jgi:predicted RNA-binding Zn ribbon-like protein